MDAELTHITDALGIDEVVRSLPGEFDDNYEVLVGGVRRMLRISPPETDSSAIQFENSVLERLGEGGVPVPVLVDTIDGDRFARLFSWVDGLPFASVGRPPGLAPSIGAAAAWIVEALRSMDPLPRRDLLWDIEKAPDRIRRLAVHIEDPQRRQMVVDIAADLDRVDMRSLPHQVIHNDLNDDNILVEEGRLSAIVDVGDALWSVRIAEPSIAATYAMLHRDDPVSIGVEVLAGYAREAEVTQAEAVSVLPLILGRLALSVSISAWRGGANPHHVRSEDAAWDLLIRLIASDHNAVSAEFETALGFPRSVEDDIRRRRELLGPELSVSYDEPLHIVAGRGAFLFDHLGRRFLDGVNNVAHIGHANPTVVSALSGQAALLNTNTRYLHNEILDYAGRLVALLPEHLSVVHLVNSGSEANELAIRMARAFTGRYGVACLEHSYHGNTSTLVDVSHYKFAGPGGDGRRPWVTVFPSPDPYRSPEYAGDGAAERYMGEAGGVPDELACLITESLPGVAGQIRPESSVMSALCMAVQAAGALVIADEVQAGFGRVGSSFWSFELHGIAPDIVTMGKPIGNGHPLGAVVTTRAVADAFDTGMEYFNTFGGNPVSAAAGNAVLDVLEDEELQRNALEVGSLLKERLGDLSERHVSIGDVRGEGLYLGVELVADRLTREPDAELAHRVVQEARRRGVLLSTDGPYHNVIKIKPPLVFSSSDAERLAGALGSALSLEP